MTEEKLYQEYLEFKMETEIEAYRKIIDWWDKNKKPAQTNEQENNIQVPNFTGTNVNNTTNNNSTVQEEPNRSKSKKTNKNEFRATIKKCYSNVSQQNNPMEVLIFELESGEKLKGFLTWTENNGKANFYNYFKPLGFMSYKGIPKQKNFDFLSLVGTEVIVETTHNDGFPPNVQKIKKVIKRPETDEIPW